MNPRAHERWTWIWPAGFFSLFLLNNLKPNPTISNTCRGGRTTKPSCTFFLINGSLEPVGDVADRVWSDEVWWRNTTTRSTWSWVNAIESTNHRPGVPVYWCCLLDRTITACIYDYFPHLFLAASVLCSSGNPPLTSCCKLLFSSLAGPPVWGS